MLDEGWHGRDRNLQDMDSEIIAQLPQVEVACDILYNSQVSDRNADGEGGCGSSLANGVD